MEKKVKIAACMMVKNEEKNLHRCLSSIQDFVDEIVIVDTGSTDRTIEIAKSYGAKVYEHPWENNFSLHRNQSIGYASKDIDWILIIDADEELVYNKNSVEPSKQIFSAIPDDINAVLIHFIDLQGGKIAVQFQSARFFRNGRIKYDGIVHNKPVYDGTVSIHKDFTIKHYGYDLTPERQAAKKKRTETLLLKRISENPKDYEAHFYIGQIYSVACEHDNVIKYTEKYIAHKNEIIDFNEASYFTLVRSYMAKKDFPNAGRILTLGLQGYPESIDLNFITVELGALTGQALLIEKGSAKFIELYSKLNANPEQVGNKFCFSLNLDALAYCMQLAAMIKLDTGFRYLKNIKTLLPGLSNPEQTIKDVKANLGRIDMFALGGIFNDIENKNKVLLKKAV